MACCVVVALSSDQGKLGCMHRNSVQPQFVSLTLGQQALLVVEASTDRKVCATECVLPSRALVVACCWCCC